MIKLLSPLVVIIVLAALPSGSTHGHAGTIDTGPVPTEGASAASMESDAFARRVLATTDLVLERHSDPPTRQAMILAGVKALARKAERPVAAGLSQRISAMAARDDFARLLEQIWAEASESSTIEADELQAAVFDGLCSVVPGHPDIIPPKELDIQRQLVANRYVGIGIQLAMEADEKLPVITAPFPRSPARLAGARPNDRILQVDGTSTENRTLEETVQMLRGPEGTRVTIVVRQPDSDETRTLDMTRSVIPIETVLGYRRESETAWDFRTGAAEPIGYMRIRAVVASTLHELRQAARALENRDTRALVIDLRNLPGGQLDHFLLLADELLDEAVLGRSRDAQGTVREYHSGPDSLFPRWPMVVIVNRHTASAAEFLAATLQDNKRAVIVGEPTPGACHIRQQFDLPDGFGAIVLRTGTLERPDGRSLARPDEQGDHENAGTPRLARVRPVESGVPWGVRPDHVVEMNDDQLRAWLKWRHEQDVAEPPANAGPTAPDPQLDKALELLRSALDEMSRQANRGGASENESG